MTSPNSAASSTPYTIDQAVADSAVVPLLYEGRMVELEQNQAAIDIWFERHTQGLTDRAEGRPQEESTPAPSMLNKAEQVIYMRGLRHQRALPPELAGHRLQGAAGGPNKAAALRYKAFLDELGLVTREVIISPPDEREGYDEDRRRNPPTRWSAFWQRMMKRYGTEDDYNQADHQAFKFGDEPEILIVVDKLLTGFDAPRNTVLYSDAAAQGPYPAAGHRPRESPVRGRDGQPVQGLRLHHRLRGCAGRAGSGADHLQRAGGFRGGGPQGRAGLDP